MENFVVSARKYRPGTFDTVVGQEAITVTLKNAIRNNQLAQAFLFTGPRGVGKTTCARILAKTINCQNLRENIEPCNACESCLTFDRSASFNIHELDAASNNSVEGIRSLVDQVRIPPQDGKYKVYIIDEVHMLSQAAFNAFLKTLEEPPKYAKFILATTEKHKIIPTILSRCQIYDFRRITVEDISRHLEFVAKSENISYEPEALNIIAQKADGALRDALSIFDQLVNFAGTHLTYERVIANLNVLDYDYFFQITQYILTGDTTNTLLTLNDIIEAGFDGQHFLIGYGEHLRNLLVSKDPQTVKLLEVSENIRQRFISQASQCRIDFLIRALDIYNKCDAGYRISSNKRLHLELALMQMASLTTALASKTSAVAEPTRPDQQQSQPPSAAAQPVVAAKASPAQVSPVPLEVKTPPVAESKSGIIVHENPEKKNGLTFNVQNKIPSLKDLQRGFGTARFTEELAENEADQEEAVMSNDLLTQDDVERVWDEFSKRYEKNSQSLFIALTSNTPLLNENKSIDFMVDNKMQEVEVESIKTELTRHLRAQLSDSSVFLNLVVKTSAQKETKPVTPEDKLKFLAQKNPDILRFKDELKLDFDY